MCLAASYFLKVCQTQPVRFPVVTGRDLQIYIAAQRNVPLSDAKLLFQRIDDKTKGDANSSVLGEIYFVLIDRQSL